MREIRLANALITRVLDVADQKGLATVDEVEVGVGEAQGIEWSALATAFSAVTDGTIAASADLKLENIPITAYCRHCGSLFVPGQELFVCLRCRRANARVVAGNDIFLKTVNGRIHVE